MKLPAKILLIAVLVPIPVLILICLDVATGQAENSAWMSPWLNWPLIMLAPFGFGWALFSSYLIEGKPAKFFYVVLFWGLLSLLWFYLFFIVAVNFQVAIGGKI
jgi:hypothetical protein